MFIELFHISYSFSFTEYFWALKQYGFKIAFAEYVKWRAALMKLTLASRDNALYPLLHFVLDDLPTRSQTPLLDWCGWEMGTKSTPRWRLGSSVMRMCCHFFSFFGPLSSYSYSLVMSLSLLLAWYVFVCRFSLSLSFSLPLLSLLRHPSQNLAFLLLIRASRCLM